MLAALNSYLIHFATLYFAFKINLISRSSPVALVLDDNVLVDVLPVEKQQQNNFKSLLNLISFVMAVGVTHIVHLSSSWLVIFFFLLRVLLLLFWSRRRQCHRSLSHFGKRKPKYYHRYDFLTWWYRFPIFREDNQRLRCRQFSGGGGTSMANNGKNKSKKRWMDKLVFADLGGNIIEDTRSMTLSPPFAIHVCVWIESLMYLRMGSHVPSSLLTRIFVRRQQFKPSPTKKIVSIIAIPKTLGWLFDLSAICSSICLTFKRGS